MTKDEILEIMPKRRRWDADQARVTYKKPTEEFCPKNEEKSGVPQVTTSCQKCTFMLTFRPKFSIKRLLNG